MLGEREMNELAEKYTLAVAAGVLGYTTFLDRIKVTRTDNQRIVTKEVGKAARAKQKRKENATDKKKD